MNIAFKSEFFDDLDDIAEYVTKYFGAELAQKIANDIYQGCFVLADHPFIGREYLRKRYFRYLVVERKNVVFYHVADGIVTVHRVFDGRRDYLDAINSTING